MGKKGEYFRWFGYSKFFGSAMLDKKLDKKTALSQQVK
jgi:hypothetical protein